MCSSNDRNNTSINKLTLKLHWWLNYPVTSVTKISFLRHSIWLPRQCCIELWGGGVPQFLSKETPTRPMTFSPATGRSIAPGHGFKRWPRSLTLRSAHLTSLRKEEYSQQRTTPLSHLILIPVSQRYRCCFAEPTLSNRVHWIWVYLYSVNAQHLPQVTQTSSPISSAGSPKKVSFL